MPNVTVPSNSGADPGTVRARATPGGSYSVRPDKRGATGAKCLARESNSHKHTHTFGRQRRSLVPRAGWLAPCFDPGSNVRDEKAHDEKKKRIGKENR
jgi:hypothetical protein